MSARSYLFVPGDSERKLEKALGSGADALILDLEDSVAPERTERARGMVREALQGQRKDGPQLWVRVNPLTTPKALPDLAAIVGARPFGIMVPKLDGAADVVMADHFITALEAAADVEQGAIRIFAVVTETAKSVFALGSYPGCSARLAAMTWGAEDLSTALGASTNRDETGELAFTYKVVRSLCLAGAKAADAAAIDTLWADFRDPVGLEKVSVAARREGFNGKIAIHPDQVAVINASFTPSEAEIEHAKRVIAAFNANPGLGTVGLDGKMLDMPHLKQARALLAAAGQ